MRGIADKVAIVTGGAGGIGRSTAARLSDEGASVVVADIDREGAEDVVSQLRSDSVAVQFDATDDASVQRVIEITVERFGGVDILCNNVALTATAWSTDTTLTDTSLDVWDRTWRVNLRSYVVSTRVAIPHMVRRGGGTVINMSSRAARVGSPGLIAYGTLKAGVTELTRYIAVQYGRHNIRCNAIAPGLILTPQLAEHAPGREQATLQRLPFPRVGQPEDVAAVVAFLASDDSAFINGALIPVDGGQTAGADTRPRRRATDR